MFFTNCFEQSFNEDVLFSQVIQESYFSSRLSTLNLSGKQPLTRAGNGHNYLHQNGGNEGDDVISGDVNNGDSHDQFDPNCGAFGMNGGVSGETVGNSSSQSAMAHASDKVRMCAIRSNGF